VKTLLKKALLLAYYFPPMVGPAAVRLGGLAKLLPGTGWLPIVLTRQYPELMALEQGQVYPAEYTDLAFRVRLSLGLSSDESIDQALMQKDNDDRNLHKQLVRFIWKYTKSALLWPDVESGWLSVVHKALPQILASHDIKVVISSSFPVTSHRIAASIKKKYGIPWVADYRDLWTQNPVYPYGSIRRRIETEYEKYLMSSADAMITVSDPLNRKLASLHEDRIPVFTIKNGFDESLLNDNGIGCDLDGQFSLTFTGSITPDKEEYQILFAAIAQMISMGRIKRDDIVLKFAGFADSWNTFLFGATEYGIADRVVYQGVLSRTEITKLQRGSQILYFMGWKDATETGLYSAKIFEYLAACRPILMTGGVRTVVSELIETTNTGVHAITLEQVCAYITSSYETFLRQGAVPYTGDLAEVKKHSQKNMAQLFGAVLDKVCEK
jgi:glycosyltransferase involved in cell wall biosynthesis